MPIPSRRLLPIAAVTSAALWLAAARPISSADAALDVGAVRRAASEFVERYGAALESGDADTVRGCIDPSPDFAWYTDGAKRYASADDIIAGVAGLASAGITLKTEYSAIEPLALGSDVAYVRARFATVGTGPDGGEFAFAGAVTMLLTRADDGGWRVRSGHSSTPGGPPDDADDEH